MCPSFEFSALFDRDDNPFFDIIALPTALSWITPYVFHFSLSSSFMCSSWSVCPQTLLFLL